VMTMSGSTNLPSLLHGRLVMLRPLGEEDVERVAEIQAQPGVARWWGAPDEADLRRQANGQSDEQAFVIESDGELVGLIEFCEENEPDFRHAGMDVFVSESHQGRGLGTDALRTLARYLIEERGHHRLTIDPAAENTPAIATFERVGFRPVGRMREYWRAPDGTWQDGLLMDLLAGEFDPANEKFGLVRRMFDVFNAGDDLVALLWTEDAEVVPAPGFPEGGPVRGHEQVTRFFDGLREGWQEGMSVTLHGLEEIGDKVLASFTWQAVGETSGIEASSDWLAVYSFRGGKVLRVEYFSDRDAALAAARAD
jgi:aminoglycoside 6'-N-acetyltransferase